MKKLILLFGWLIPVLGFAQQYEMDWYKIAGGGGTSTNSQYSLSGTIGQPDASVAMTGGGYQLAGGFWSGISLIQTTSAPTLYISYSQPNNLVTIHWMTSSCWKLEQNANLLDTTNWIYSAGITNDSCTNYLTFTPVTGAHLFFRLEMNTP